MGYHLNLKFDESCDSVVGKYNYAHVESYALSTDRIFSFQSFKQSRKTLSANDIIRYMTESQVYRNSPHWLRNKLNILNEKFGLYNIDDLGLVVYSRPELRIKS